MGSGYAVLLNGCVFDNVKYESKGKHIRCNSSYMCLLLLFKFITLRTNLSKYIVP